MMRNVESGEPARRKRRCHGAHGRSGSAPYVGNLDAPFECSNDATDGRKNGRNEVCIAPRFERSLDTNRSVVTVCVVVESETALEARRKLGQPLHGGWESMKHTHTECGMIAVSENRSRFGRQ
jgi:hypothetical protein